LDKNAKNIANSNIAKVYKTKIKSTCQKADKKEAIIDRATLKITGGNG
jgi:hypothetical protein